MENRLSAALQAGGGVGPPSRTEWLTDPSDHLVGEDNAHTRPKPIAFPVHAGPVADDPVGDEGHVSTRPGA